MPITETLISLEGLSVGDAFGERFFGRDPSQRIEDHQIQDGIWQWTDDTHMALSIVETLKTHQRIDQDTLIQRLVRRYMQDPRRGYGGGARRLLEDVAQGYEWRQVSRNLFGGGSYGNGAAMRVAPIGGYFAGSLERAALEARLSAEVTHMHPEGIAGAVAVAVAAAVAAQEAFPTGNNFLESIISFVPEGLTRKGIVQALSFPKETPVSVVAEALGSGRNVSAQDTVPFCLWCAAHHLFDYEEALWMTVAGLGDRDTTCAIVGGIVALSSRNIPSEWLKRREPLPDFAKGSLR